MVVIADQLASSGKSELGRDAAAIRSAEMWCSKKLAKVENGERFDG